MLRKEQRKFEKFICKCEACIGNWPALMVLPSKKREMVKLCLLIIENLIFKIYFFPQFYILFTDNIREIQKRKEKHYS